MSNEDDRDQSKLSDATKAEQEAGRKAQQENAAALAKVTQSREADAKAADPADPAEAEKEQATADAIKDHAAGQEVKPTSDKRSSKK